MSRGRPRKYKTKRESKAAKKAHTQLFVTFVIALIEAGMEEWKRKHVVSQQVHSRSLNWKSLIACIINWTTWSPLKGRVRVPVHPIFTANWRNCVSDLPDLENADNARAIASRVALCIHRDRALPKCDGSRHQKIYSPENILGICSILWGIVIPIICQFWYDIYRFGHAIQTLETDFQWTFDTTSLQTPNNWQYGSREEFRLTILVNEETSEDWTQYKHLLKDWIDFMVIPWDPTSPLYEYHRAQFTYQYVSQKLKEISGA